MNIELIKKTVLFFQTCHRPIQTGTGTALTCRDRYQSRAGMCRSISTLLWSVLVDAGWGWSGSVGAGEKLKKLKNCLRKSVIFSQAK